MSNLNRYKKGPVIKLPKFAPAKKVVPPDNNDDDDDDDFQAPKILSQIKRSSVDKKIPKSSGSSKSQMSSGISPSSKYSIKLGKSQSEYFTKIEKSKDKTGSSSLVSTTTKSTKNELENLESKDNVEDNVGENKVLCPFCWKRLNDKLTGTTHVKACAKNLPTSQIFEALQLQEKQIKEWETLGIAYPGFVDGSNAKGKNVAKKGGNNNKAPRTRKKKLDSELELAIALSESLHEEVERRQTKENSFIIENGLEKDIELLPIIKKSTDLKKSKDVPVKAIVEVPPSNSRRKRGDKGNILDLPLYKSTETDKMQAVEKKLNKILDENEDKLESNSKEFYTREAISVSSLQLPPRLEAFKNKENKLWKLAQAEESDKMYETKLISDCKIQSVESPLIASDQVQKKKSSQIINQVSSNAKLSKSSNDETTQKKSDVPIDSSKPVKKISKETKTSSVDDVRGSVKVVQDIMMMFVKKEDVDLVVYAREEKPIKCHKLIVKARCKKLLEEIVASKSPTSGRKREVIPLTCFSHVAVKAFVKFLYCDRLLSQLKGQDLEDFTNLCDKYEMDLNSESYETPTKTLPVVVQEVYTQTDFPDPQTSETILKSKCNRDRSRVVAAHRSIDMFAEMNDDDDEEDNIFEEQDILENNNDCPPDGLEKSIINLGNRKPDGNRSPDLFDDDWDDELLFEATPPTKLQESKKSPAKCLPIKSDNGILEDELMTQVGNEPLILLSPKPYNKRTRSVSPFVDFQNTSLTASQMAEYIDHAELLDLEDSPQKANKKHKLDLESSPVKHNNIDGSNDSITILDNSMEIDISSHNNCIGVETPIIVSQRNKSARNLSSKFSATEAVAENLNPPLSPLNISYNTFSNYIKNTSLPLPVSSPTVLPSTTLQNPITNSTPVPTVQTTEQSDFDPFGNDDDSCFLNLPSQLLEMPPEPPIQKPSTPKRTNTFGALPVIQEKNPTNSKKATKVVKNVLKDKVANDSQTSKKKSDRVRSLSQDPPVTRNVPVPSTPAASTTGNQQSTNTPLLNYSTIDTPILKKELKRYGLKPLPRSKAKVILRHIFKETH